MKVIQEELDLGDLGTVTVKRFMKDTPEDAEEVSDEMVEDTETFTRY